MAFRLGIAEAKGRKCGKSLARGGSPDISETVYAHAKALLPVQQRGAARDGRKAGPAGSRARIIFLMLAGPWLCCCLSAAVSLWSVLGASMHPA